LRFADELMRHSNERQLLETQKTHAFAVNIYSLEVSSQSAL
jgi:hypothetical protein